MKEIQKSPTGLLPPSTTKPARYNVIDFIKSYSDLEVESHARIVFYAIFYPLKGTISWFILHPEELFKAIYLLISSIFSVALIQRYAPATFVNVFFLLTLGSLISSFVTGVSTNILNIHSISKEKFRSLFGLTLITIYITEIFVPLPNNFWASFSWSEHVFKMGYALIIASISVLIGFILLSLSKKSQTQEIN